MVMEDHLWELVAIRDTTNHIIRPPTMVKVQVIKGDLHHTGNPLLLLRSNIVISTRPPEAILIRL